MSTRFYLPHTAETPAFSPTPDAAWEDTSGIVRCIARTTKINDTLANIDFTDSDTTNKDVLLRQYVSAALDVGLTITGSQSIKAQCRLIESSHNNNLFFTIGIRVIASDGTTVQKTVLSVTRDNIELADENVIPLTNRQFTATSAATNYTTQAGDRLVIEIGAGGDPGSGGDGHVFTMRLGDSAGSDLAEDDISTTDNNPWLELTDTLFGGVVTPISPFLLFV